MDLWEEPVISGWIGRKATDAFDVVWLKQMDGAVDAEDPRILTEVADVFFTRRPVVLQSRHRWMTQHSPGF